MTEHLLSADILSRASEIIANRLGLYFPQDRWNDLERGITLAAQMSGRKNINEYLGVLASASLSKEQLKTLAGFLTVSETYFFRDEKLFEILKFQILPELIEKRKGKEQQIRIWSAGCSSGEEPYSVAILLQQLIRNIDEWNITILASDINPVSLKKMTKGIYNEWSFRGAQPYVKQNYFVKTQDRRYAIQKKFRDMITPAYINLAEDAYPSLLNDTNAMDIIICRNVLMYFKKETAAKTINGFYNCLVDGGWLIVGPSETSQTLFAKFASVYYPDNILYRKNKHIQSPNINLPRFDNQQNPDISSETDLQLHNVVNYNEAEKTEDFPEQTSEERISSLHASAYQQANELYREGNLTEAAKKLSDYFTYNYNDPKAHALLARIYANLGKLREAFSCCEKAVSLNKLDAANHYLLAAILQEQNRPEEALVSLKRTIYLDKNFVTAHIMMGNISKRLGREYESQKSFRNALTLLEKHKPDEILPETDGITAGRLIEIIKAANYEGASL